jgi:acetolactate synthase-1/2/3 large subunit
VVDIDGDEATKVSIHADIPVIADARAAVDAFLADSQFRVHEHHTQWVLKCQKLRDDYPVYHPSMKNEISGVNAYHFIHRLSELLEDDAVIVTDVGFCYLPTFQSIALKRGQRLIHSAGVSPMGWGLPAAVGAAFAAPGQQIVCLTGDGGAMMNIQELQTIATNQLPIAVFLFDNDGYATMKITQTNNFRRTVMSGHEHGVGMPDFAAVAEAFGIASMCVESNHAMEVWLPTALDIGAKRPILVNLRMKLDQVVAPRVQSIAGDDGKFLPGTIDRMWPPVPHDDFTYSNIEENQIAHK